MPRTSNRTSEQTVGNMAPVPRYKAEKCWVCRHPDREEAERLLYSQNASYADVLARFPAMGEKGISVWILRNHVENHLELSKAFIRHCMEEQAAKAGLSLDNDAGPLGDYVVMAKIGVQRVIERMALGEIEPDFKDGIAMAKLLVEIDKIGQDSMDLQTMAQAFMVWTNIIKDEAPPEVFQRIGMRISTDPILKGLNESVTQKTAIEAGAR